MKVLCRLLTYHDKNWVYVEYLVKCNYSIKLQWITRQKKLHIFFGQNNTKTDTVLFDDYGWGVWYVLIMVKVFYAVFMYTNISSHPKDIWELIKPKSWRGGRGAFLLLLFCDYEGFFNIVSFS